MKLREASPVDFGFIRSIARKPEHALHITDEDDAALMAYHTSSDCRLLICETGENHPAGFALFCDIHARSRTVELRRLALDTVGLGRGGDFLNLLMGYGFDRLGAGRLWLDTGDTNLRAQRAYARAGFTLEGRLRMHDHCAPLDRNFDTLLYGILRAEWAAGRG